MDNRLAALTECRLAAARRDLGACLDATPRGDRFAYLEAVALRTGGTILFERDGWGPLETSITVLGITGMGAGIEAAVADWMQNAARSERAAREADPEQAA